MTNRLTAAARWMARTYLGRRLNRLVGGNQYWPDAAPKRKRATGVLRAVLRVLADRPATEHDVVLQVRGNYTGRQCRAALRYAYRRGYAQQCLQQEAAGATQCWEWGITEEGLARLEPPRSEPVAADGRNREE